MRGIRVGWNECIRIKAGGVDHVGDFTAYCSKEIVESLAIICLSLILPPFAVIESILKVLLLGLIASFRRSQVFFGFLE